MTRELILAVTEHRKFGTLFNAYVITPTTGNSFYTSIEKANTINLQEVDELTPEKATLIKLIGEYDDSYIANLFTRKKEEARDFIKNVDKEFIDLRIKPHIERRLHQIVDLLPKLNVRLFLKDRQYATFYLTDQILMAGPNAQAVFNFERDANGLKYFLTINHEQETISLKNKKAQIITDSPCALVLNQRLYTFPDIDSKKLLPFFEKEHISIPKQTEKTYFEKFVFGIIQQYMVKAKGFTIEESTQIPTRHLYLQNDMKANPVLLLKFQYLERIILPNNLDENFVIMETRQDEYIFKKVIRNKTFEKEAKEQLKSLGLISKDGVHFYPPSGENNDVEIYAIIHWLNRNSGLLQEKGFLLKQHFFTHRYNVEEILLDIQMIESSDWFDIRGVVTIGSFKFPFIRLRRNILKNIREFELPDGTIAILPKEWFARYKEVFLLADAHPEEFKLSKFHFNLLNSVQVGIRSSYGEKIKELFASETSLEHPQPIGLQATLRPYQAMGYQWMLKLKQHKFGGCLADDMGLGKTLQTLTLLLESSRETIEQPVVNAVATQTQLSLFDGPKPPEFKETQRISSTSLIVMPASLIYNWYNEVAKFTPSLKVFKYVGNNRGKDIQHFRQYNLVLTTYGVIRNEVEELKKFPFHYVVLDESQVIKNPDSKIYQSVIQLNASHKLVLTGTPIENSLTDLWSQMNFVNRGLLGNFSFFKNEFVTPIEKQGDVAKSEKLKALIHPFILRRTKDQVAKDLPPRTEQVRFCEMSEVQQRIYEEEKSAIRNTIFESLEKKGVSQSTMMVLQAITRLRQLANHPKLVKIEEESGKFEDVTRMLQNVIAEKHKVLLFSSFVNHLNLYKTYLEENGLKYSLLTGHTRNRQQVIDEFQNDPEIRVFLISLKAGGVGLNLTAADYVFLLDPWWNPAAENQAINRAHRIGQDKNVFVYRFISSGSIEEKIMKLQDRKSELADVFINTNNPFKALSAEKIKELFD